MSPKSYAYWLQGWVELNDGAQPTPEQWEAIKEHLALVFQKVTTKTVAPLPAISPGLSERLCGRAPEKTTYCYASIPSFDAPFTLDERLKRLQAAEETPPEKSLTYDVVAITC